MFRLRSSDCRMSRKHVTCFVFYLDTKMDRKDKLFVVNEVRLQLKLSYCDLLETLDDVFFFFCRSARSRTAINASFLKPKRSRISTCGKCLIRGLHTLLKFLFLFYLNKVWHILTHFRISNCPHGPSAKFLVQNSKFSTLVNQCYVEV